MYACYILKSLIDNNLYIGSTSDIKRRISEHNSGKVFSTKSRRPFELVYCELYKSESDARKREHRLKLNGRALGQLKGRITDSIK